MVVVGAMRQDQIGVELANQANDPVAASSVAAARRRGTPARRTARQSAVPARAASSVRRAVRSGAVHLLMAGFSIRHAHKPHFVSEGAVQRSCAARFHVAVVGVGAEDQDAERSRHDAASRGGRGRSEERFSHPTSIVAQCRWRQGCGGSVMRLAVPRSSVVLGEIRHSSRFHPDET